MRKRKFFFSSLFSLLIVSFSIIFSICFNVMSETGVAFTRYNTNGDSGYSLTISSQNRIVNNYATTKRNTHIQLENNGVNYNSNKVILLCKGYFTNVNPIKGITGITLDNLDGKVEILYSYVESTNPTKVMYSGDVLNSDENIQSVDFDLEHLPNFVKVVALEDSSFDDLTICFECENFTESIYESDVDFGYETNGIGMYNDNTCQSIKLGEGYRSNSCLKCEIFADNEPESDVVSIYFKDLIDQGLLELPSDDEEGRMNAFVVDVKTNDDSLMELIDNTGRGLLANFAVNDGWCYEWFDTVYFGCYYLDNGWYRCYYSANLIVDDPETGEYYETNPCYFEGIKHEDVEGINFDLYCGFPDRKIGTTFYFDNLRFISNRDWEIDLNWCMGPTGYIYDIADISETDSNAADSFTFEFQLTDDSVTSIFRIYQDEENYYGDYYVTNGRLDDDYVGVNLSEIKNGWYKLSINPRIATDFVGNKTPNIKVASICNLCDCVGMTITNPLLNCHNLTENKCNVFGEHNLDYEHAEVSIKGSRLTAIVYCTRVDCFEYEYQSKVGEFVIDTPATAYHGNLGHYVWELDPPFLTYEGEPNSVEIW